MKVLHLITDFRRGGESTILSSFLPWSQKKGHRNVLVVLAAHSRGNKDDSLLPAIRAAGIPVYDLGIDRPWKFARVFKLWSILRREKPDLVHTYLFHASVAGRVLAWFAGYPVSSSVVSSDEWKKRHHSFLEGFTSRFARGILANAHHIRERLAQRDGVSPHKVTVVYNGVDSSRFPHLDESASAPLREAMSIDLNTFVVGWVGRFHPAKDPLTMIDAFRLFHEKVPDSLLLLLGDGELFDAARERAGALPVRFLGNVAGPELAHCYRVFDCLAVSSKLEGIPAVVFEAMHLGVPLVSFAVGGIPEVVVPGTGFLATRHNAQGLGEALLRLHSTPPEILHSIRNAARARVQTQFDNQASYEGRLRFFLSISQTSAEASS